MNQPTQKKFNLALARKLKLTDDEIKLFKTLSNPQKIQDFLNTLPANLEKKGETLRGVQASLKAHTCHCIEGALIASLALYLHGRAPLIVDMRASHKDDDHVIAVFKQGAYWGAISKSNRSILRFRDPIYKNIHELMMSYVHEYFLPTGEKTLRTYSVPFDLRKAGTIDWIHSTKNLWNLSRLLNKLPHKKLLPPQVRTLRPADPIELKANLLTEY